MATIPAGFFPDQWGKALGSFQRLVQQLAHLRTLLTECVGLSAENSDVPFVVDQFRQELDTLKFLASDAEKHWSTISVNVATAVGRFSLDRPADNVAWCASILDSAWRFHNGMQREVSFKSLNLELCVQRLPLHLQRISDEIDQWPERITAELRAGALCETFESIGNDFLAISGPDDVADRAVQSIAAKAYRLLQREIAAGNFRFEDYGTEYGDAMRRPLNPVLREQKDYTAWQNVCFILAGLGKILSSDPNVTRSKSRNVFAMLPSDWAQRAKNYAEVCFWLHHQIKPTVISPVDYAGWPTITRVATGLGENKGTVSRLLDRGKLRDNGLKGKKRRVDPASVLEYCETHRVVYNDN